MAKINRYTQLSGPKFDPLSFEQLSLVPMQLRQQQDALEKQASELGVFDDINRLNVDDPLVKQTISDYEQKISDYSDRLQNEGFSNLNKQELRNLARNRRDLLSPTGTLGKATNAYNAYKANEKQLADMYKKGDISADEYQLGLQKSLNAYNQAKGVEGDATYNPFTAYKRQDIVKKARDIAKSIPTTKLESLGFTARKMPSGLTRYYDTKTGRDYTPKEAIAKAVRDQLLLDQDVVNDLTQRQQLGLIKDPNEYLNTLGNVLERDYSKNDVTKSRSGYFDQAEVAKYKKKLDESRDPNTPYFTTPIESKRLQDKSFVNTLSNIAEGKVHPIVHAVKRPQYVDEFGVRNPNYEIELKAYNNLKNKENKPYTLDDLDPSEKAKFEHIKTKLLEQTPELVDYSEDLLAKVVSDYVSQFQDVQYQNTTIQPHTASGQLQSLGLLSTKDVNATNRNLENLIKGNSIQLWDENQNPIDLKDLPDDFKVEYIGYTAPNNHLDQFKKGNKTQSVAPHVIQIRNSNNKNIFKGNIYAERPEYQRNTSEFKAFEVVKGLTDLGTTVSPGLYDFYNIENDNPLSKKISKIESKFNPITNRYSIKLYDKKGNLVPILNEDTKEWQESVNDMNADQLTEYLYTRINNLK